MSLALLDAFMQKAVDARTTWIGKHGRLPSKAFVSCEMAARILCEMDQPCPVLMPPSPSIGLYVLSCEWFEDRTLTGDALRFEA